MDKIGNISLINGDCLEYMRTLPDKAFSLAIVDPPYGDALQEVKDSRGLRFHGNRQNTDDQWTRYGSEDPRDIRNTRGRFKKYRDEKSVTRTGGTWATKYGKTIVGWDVAPTEEYFKELFRVSENQIIWGGNYFFLPPTRCFLIWHKLSISEKFTMAMCEYAWTSFNANAKWFDCAPQGNPKDPRFHPTQKPVELYAWILNNYAKEGDTILDTHGGSMSSMIACYELGFTATCCELDPRYYEKAKARLEQRMQQGKLL